MSANSGDIIAQILGGYGVGGGNAMPGANQMGQQSAIGAGITNPTTMGTQGLGNKANQWMTQNSELMGGISEGLGAFSSLANMYMGFKALSQQKKQFKFQKNAWNKNYNNQVKDYENNLKDRWTAKNAYHELAGKDYQSMDSYVGDRQLTGT